MCHGSNNYNMHDCYFGHRISKAGPEVLEKVRIMDNVQSSYYNTRLSETNLLNHYDVYGATLRKNLCNNISNSQFVMNLKCHHTPLSVKKLLVVRDAKVTQAMLVCPIKNVAEWEKTNDRYTSHINCQ